MRDAMAVLIRPVVSEKSYGLMDQNVYVFIVDPGATKIDVRHAVEQAFGVRVAKVNTLTRKGKSLRNRRTGKIGHHPHVVGDEQDRGPHVISQLVQEVEDPRLDGDVERRRRLVGDDQLGAARHRHRDQDALAHSA